ncbi:MAG: hypothetical protein WKG01_42515 [Kofleriaceae bacterium]
MTRPICLAHGFGLLASIAGCVDQPPEVFTVKVESASSSSCHEGDTIRASRTDADRAVSTVIAPCEASVELELPAASGEIVVELLATRGAEGLADDVVVAARTGESVWEPGIYRVFVNHGFAILNTQLLRQGYPVTCAEADIASVRYVIELVGGPPAATVDFPCSLDAEYSPPLRAHETYLTSVVGLDANGLEVGSGLGGPVQIIEGNQYVSSSVPLIVRNP